MDELVQFLENIVALQIFDEVVAEFRVVVRTIDAERCRAIRLDEIFAIEIFVGQVEIVDVGLVAETVEEVASKRKQRVVDPHGRQNGRPEVDLLGNLLAAMGWNAVGMVECDRDGFRTPYVVVFGLEMFAVREVGGDDEQGVVEPLVFGDAGKEVAEGAVGIIDGLLETGPEVALFRQLEIGRYDEWVARR